MLTALLLWRWGRQLFGPPAGLLLMLAFALEPTALAHGALFKNDLAATFSYLLFFFCAFKFWREPGLLPAASLGGATLLAAMSKLSLVFLIPLAPCLILLRHLTRRPVRFRPLALALALVLLIPYLGLMAACQFETLPATEVAAQARNPSVPLPFRAAARLLGWLPAPKPIWQGSLSLWPDPDYPDRVYLLGGILPGGSLLYFPMALAVKIPAGLQLLLAGGALLVLLGFKRRRWRPSDAFWLLPGFFYITLASLATLQLGVRLVLPALPFGLLLAGVAVQRLWQGRGRVLLACLFTWLLFQSARIYPHGISFFNLWTGGPENGLRYLADSNLDWEQALPELADFVHTRGIPKIKLSYFGANHPWAYLREQELEPLAPPWGDDLVQSTVLRPSPGYYAISASLLPGQLFDPKYQNYYQVFRMAQPIAKIGYSIYLYKF